MRTFTVKINGNVYQAEVEETTAGGQTLPNINAPAAVAAPAAAPAPAAAAPAPAPAAAPKPAAAPAGGAGSMTSPLPGTVLKIVAGEGASVNAGDVVLILEAMKMENEICAPSAGTVSIKVNQGDAVNTDDLLFVVS